MRTRRALKDSKHHLEVYYRKESTYECSQSKTLCEDFQILHNPKY